MVAGRTGDADCRRRRGGRRLGDPPRSVRVQVVQRGSGGRHRRRAPRARPAPVELARLPALRLGRPRLAQLPRVRRVSNVLAGSAAAGRGPVDPPAGARGVRARACRLVRVRGGGRSRQTGRCAGETGADGRPVSRPPGPDVQRAGRGGPAHTRIPRSDRLPASARPGRRQQHDRPGALETDRAAVRATRATVHLRASRELAWLQGRRAQRSHAAAPGGGRDPRHRGCGLPGGSTVVAQHDRILRRSVSRVHADLAALSRLARQPLSARPLLQLPLFLRHHDDRA